MKQGTNIYKLMGSFRIITSSFFLCVQNTSDFDKICPAPSLPLQDFYVFDSWSVGGCCFKHAHDAENLTAASSYTYIIVRQLPLFIIYMYSYCMYMDNELELSNSATMPTLHEANTFF